MKDELRQCEMHHLFFAWPLKRVRLNLNDDVSWLLDYPRASRRHVSPLACGITFRSMCDVLRETVPTG